MNLVDTADSSNGDSLDQKLRRRWGWMPYRLMGGAALLGCAIVLICDFTMWFLVPGYSPVAETISDLGAGRHQEVQDSGIVAFALGTTLLGVGLTLRGEGSTIAALVRGAVFLLAVDISMIALWNEYGDGDPGGFEIHRFLVIVLYLLVPFILYFGCRAAPIEQARTRLVMRSTAIAWVFLAPLFYMVPDTVDGAYERVLAAVMVASVAVSAWQLYRKP